MSFLSPLLIWGALLGAIPIIIHLLNRRRFRRVEWAPMRHLRLTIQRNRRRVQIEQWLLLLLRVAGLVLLFFLLARPVLNPTGLEGWLGSGGRSSQVVLVDDSLSMGYAADGGEPAFRRAKEVAGALLAGTRPQDRCTLLASSSPTTPILSEVEGARRDDLSGAVSGLVPTASHASWSRVLEGLDEVLKSCTYPTRQVTIITDLRRSGWGAGVAPIAKAWDEAGVRVRIVDVGDEGTSNISIRSLIPQDRTVLAGSESRWEATVRNDSTRVLSGVKAILRVDDQPTEVTLPEIAPRQAVRVPLTVRFPGAGMHDVSLELPEDELAGDNRRWSSVPVKDSLLIRLVDGEPSSEPFGSEVDFLAAPLSIGVGSAEAWRTEVVQETDFVSPRLDSPDVLVMANVAAPTAEQASRIDRMVRDGMGLMIFTGAKLDTGLYNDLLYRTNARVLPVALKSLVDEEIRGIVVEPLRPSPLEKLLDLKTSALERVPVRQIMAVDETSEEGKVRVLARWNDPGRSPAVIERISGEGRVLLWTTTADRAGNDWPIEPSFVLAMREAVLGVSRPTSFANTVSAGDLVRRVVLTSQQVSNVRVAPPGGGEPLPLLASPVQGRPDDEGPAVEFSVPDTRRAGLYRVSWDEGALGTQQDSYAVNPDARESDLDRIGQADLKTLLAPLQVEVAEARGGGADLFSPVGRELWHEAALFLLVLLVGESIVAAWVGRSR
ncbi:BatA domain-containing protein [Isosphaeraceae bacterium EP7]